jgi:hypothetical protein
VVGVSVVVVSVGVVVIAAVVGVAVTPLVAEMVGAAVVAVVDPTVVAAVVPVVAVPAVVPPPTASRKTAASVAEPPVMTGVGSELMDAFTVVSGLAYADGGMSCPVGACGATAGCGPEGLIVPRYRSRGCAATMAAESTARSTLAPYELAIGGFDVPDDVPGVAAGVEGGDIAGWPSPGV